MNSYPPKVITNFSVSFDGEDIKDNTMCAYHLANSLLGITSLLERSNYEINGNASQISIRVKSGFKEGSFIFDLVTLMSSVTVVALVNTVDIVGFTGKSINSMLSYLAFIRHTRGKPIESIHPLDAESSVVSISGDNNTVTINNLTLSLYNDNKARKEVERIVSPLKQNGIDYIKFTESNGESLKINKEDVDYYDAPISEEISHEQNIALLTITQSNFMGKQTGWRFSFNENGDDDFKAEVSDDFFLTQVRQGIYKFSNGNSILAEYERIQQKMEKVSNRYVITKVIEVNHNPVKKDSTHWFNSRG